MSAAGVTLYPLDGMGLLAFSGEDAQSFLQGQLSCDVSVVANSRSTYGSYCTPQGRMLATFLLWSSGGRYFMQLPASLCESIRKRLSMYVLRAKVKIEDASGDRALFGIAAEGAARAIEAVFGGVPASAHDTLHANVNPRRRGFQNVHGIRPSVADRSYRWAQDKFERHRPWRAYDECYRARTGLGDRAT